MIDKPCTWPGCDCDEKTCAPVTTLPREPDDDDIQEAISDAMNNSEGRASAKYLRYELGRRGLWIQPMPTPLERCPACGRTDLDTKPFTCPKGGCPLGGDL